MRIAVCGPSQSGKSTLAKYMVEQHGWYHINYTRRLKEWFAADVSRHLKTPLTVEEIEANKEKYRAALQEYGVHVGFDEGNGVDEVIRDWKRLREWNTQSVIFDNVRFQSQFDKLKKHGFVLVKLAVVEKPEKPKLQLVPQYPGSFIYQYYDSTTTAKHPAENQPLVPDLTMLAKQPLEDMADTLMRLSGKVRKGGTRRAAEYQWAAS